MVEQRRLDLGPAFGPPGGRPTAPPRRQGRAPGPAGAPGAPPGPAAAAAALAGFPGRPGAMPGDAVAAEGPACPAAVALMPGQGPAWSLPEPAAPCPFMARRVAEYLAAGAVPRWSTAGDGRLDLELPDGRALSMPGRRAGLYGFNRP